MKRINRRVKMDGSWKMMMPRTVCAYVGGWRGGRVTALGGRFWRRMEAFDTIMQPQSTAGPVVGCSTFWTSLELSFFFLFFPHFQTICAFSAHNRGLIDRTGNNSTPKMSYTVLWITMSIFFVRCSAVNLCLTWSWFLCFSHLVVSDY